MRHREARLRQNQQGLLFPALDQRRSNPLLCRASSPEVFLISGRSKSFGHLPPSVLDVARSFRIARNRLSPRWQRARSLIALTVSLLGASPAVRVNALL